MAVWNPVTSCSDSLHGSFGKECDYNAVGDNERDYIFHPDSEIVSHGTLASYKIGSVQHAHSSQGQGSQSHEKGYSVSNNIFRQSAAASAISRVSSIFAV